MACLRWAVMFMTGAGASWDRWRFPQVGIRTEENQAGRSGSTPKVRRRPACCRPAVAPLPPSEWLP